MFVYVLQISGLPQDTDAFKLLHSEFGISQQAFDEATKGNQFLTVSNPHRNGELFFERELNSLGQSFTALSRAGLQFVVLRKRHNGQFKLIADYTEQLKTGRKAWREEKMRVDAASDSLESFLCQEASAEDMEVLRPLFPEDVNNLLRDHEAGVMKGSEMLQSVFPSLKGSDARRIFYQMQLLFEKRAGKWKNRLGCAWVSIYFIMAVLIGFAIFEWLTTTMDFHGLVAAPLAFVLSLIPFVGSIIAYFTATSLWGWAALITAIVFFWYYFPIVYLMIQLVLSALKGEGKSKWEAITNRSKQKANSDDHFDNDR